MRDGTGRSSSGLLRTGRTTTTKNGAPNSSAAVARGRQQSQASAVSTLRDQPDAGDVEVCEADWDGDVPTRETLEASIRHLPEGVQFSKARVHGQVSATTDEYNREMCAKMGSKICYYHEWGMNYSHIAPNIIVGSVPQDQEDIDYLRNHLGVTAILNLQEEKDWHKFDIDFGAIQDCCNRHGDIKIVRCPIVDFDAQSLRAALPGTVTRLHSLLEVGDTVYIHCTAGLGRAPGVAITYLHWLFNLSLEDAYSFFQERRKCNPRAAAIRGATMDAQLGSGGLVSFCWDSGHMGAAEHVEVTSSFNSWAAPGLELRKYADGFFMKELCLPPGLYQYKYIADGRWLKDSSLPMYAPSSHLVSHRREVRAKMGTPPPVYRDPRATQSSLPACPTAAAGTGTNLDTFTRRQTFGACNKKRLLFSPEILNP